MKIAINFNFDLTLLLYGGAYTNPLAEKWQLLRKIMILKRPNFMTFPIYRVNI